MSEHQVLAAEAAYVAAEVERDEAALRRLIDDAFVQNASTGTTSGKEALIQNLLTMNIRARELGCREAWVPTEVGNAPARGLYRALGGVEDDEPAVVYVFPLAGDGATPGEDDRA